MIIKLLVDGGEMKPGPVVGQKLGPIGINIGQVIADVNKATQEFKGTKVPVSLDIDPKTKKFKVEVSSPPTSELLKKELGLEKGTGEHKKTKIANASIEQIIKIAKTKYPNMLARDFKSAVKSVVGSAVSLGILVENKSKEIIEDIENGNFDSEIKAQKTETSSEKKAKLKEFFDKVLKDQEAAKKAEEAAKAAEEAAKLAAAQAAGGAAPAGVTGAAAATPGAAGAAGAAAAPGAATGQTQAPAAPGAKAPAGKAEKKK
jgi:large subunit ribosomal protein L11